ncbi:MAG: glycosyltransferase family 2 protein [Alphaproteobacteria bacterium]|nr:glycosyltransferase family 2 protein [Alphaproteobacteria bacterium]
MPTPTSPTDLELTILMPCLNEAETVATCVAKAVGYLERSGIAGEVVVADNGSTDGSQALATAAGARVVPVPRRGYGAALIAGIEAARGRFVIMGDSDDSYDFANLDGFVAALRGGLQLVMGNRFAGGIRPGAMPPLHRYLGNPVLTGIGRLLFRSPCGDFHCGLRGFDRAAIRGLHLDTPGMEFASEMVVKATIQGLRIGEVPTVLSPDGRSRPPHLRSWRDGWRHLRFLLMLSPRAVFLYPGLALAAVGGLASAALLFGDIHIGSLTLSYHTQAFAGAALDVGTQMVIFWIFAKIIAMDRGLLRPDQGLERLLARSPVEVGLAAGTAILLVGIVFALAALVQWGEAGFGTLQPGTTVRVVIFSTTAMILGAQLVFSAFFLGLLEHVRTAR